MRLCSLRRQNSPRSLLGCSPRRSSRRFGGEQSIAAKDIFDYFSPMREGCEGSARRLSEEPVAIPKGAEKSVVESAIETAVKEGRLWLTSGLG